MHAVSINTKSLDLIATNNGGLKPEIEPSPYPNCAATYFILPTNPNEHARIVSVDEFFDNYEFVGPEADDEFRPIREMSEEEKNAPYVLDRELLAHMVAAHASGKYNALAEQVDYDIADAMLTVMENRLKS
jgi:hypothetical protein